MKKTLGDLTTKELIDTIDLLNEISLDLLDEPLDLIDISQAKSRAYLIRTLCKQYNGVVLTSVERAQANKFFAEVLTYE